MKFLHESLFSGASSLMYLICALLFHATFFFLPSIFTSFSILVVVATLILKLDGLSSFVGLPPHTASSSLYVKDSASILVLPYFFSNHHDLLF
jgi:hypothetical protein